MVHASGLPSAAIGYPSPSNPNLLPYEHSPIPVVAGIEGFQKFQKEFGEQYPGFVYCPYIADKKNWDDSTSRIFMNQALPGCVYLPVQIDENDNVGLTAFFDAVWHDPSVAALNMTRPHKGNKDVRARTGSPETESVDILVRNRATGLLEPQDDNGPSFIEWYTNDVGSFDDRTVYIVGVGGAGSAIAKAIAQFTSGKPAKIVLVDKEDRSELARQLNGHIPVIYQSPETHIDDAELQGYVTVINAADELGKEGCLKLIERQSSSRGDKVFVDISTRANSGLMEAARTAGWQPHDGLGMSIPNNHYLLSAIAGYMGVHPPDRDHFAALVRQAQPSRR